MIFVRAAWTFPWSRHRIKTPHLENILEEKINIPAFKHNLMHSYWVSFLLWLVKYYPEDVQNVCKKIINTFPPLPWKVLNIQSVKVKWVYGCWVRFIRIKYWDYHLFRGCETIQNLNSTKLSFPLTLLSIIWSKGLNYVYYTREQNAHIWKFNSLQVFIAQSSR